MCTRLSSQIQTMVSAGAHKPCEAPGVRLHVRVVHVGYDCTAVGRIVVLVVVIV